MEMLLLYPLGGIGNKDAPIIMWTLSTHIVASKYLFFSKRSHGSLKKLLTVALELIFY